MLTEGASIKLRELILPSITGLNGSCVKYKLHDQRLPTMDGAGATRSNLCDQDSIAVVAEACRCDEGQAIELLRVHHLPDKVIVELQLTRRCG